MQEKTFLFLSNTDTSKPGPSLFLTDSQLKVPAASLTSWVLTKNMLLEAWQDGRSSTALQVKRLFVLYQR